MAKQAAKEDAPKEILGGIVCCMELCEIVVSIGSLALCLMVADIVIIDGKSLNPLKVTVPQADNPIGGSSFLNCYRPNNRSC